MTNLIINILFNKVTFNTHIHYLIYFFAEIKTFKPDKLIGVKHVKKIVWFKNRSM